MEQSTEIQEAPRYDQLIEKTRERFEIAAPSGIKFDNEKGFAIQLLENNEYLMKSAMENPGSLMQAITNVAAIGLSLNPAKKQAYLIPRNMKVGNQWVTKVFLEPSFVGLCDLATQSGVIKFIQAFPVYEGEKFTYQGLDKEPIHEANPFVKRTPEQVQEQLQGVYCVAKTVDGEYLTEMMSVEDINGIRGRSEAYKAFKEKQRGNGGPWVTDYIQMALKSVVRRAFKMWPKSPAMEHLAEAVHASNENEGFEPLLTSPSMSNYTVEQKKYFDQLIETSQGMEMYLFQLSIEENVFNNLYHSFEKGTKGRYQQIVNELLASGGAQLRECVEAINICVEGDDDLGFMEYFETASENETAYYLEHCSDDARAMYKEQVGEE